MYTSTIHAEWILWFYGGSVTDMMLSVLGLSTLDLVRPDLLDFFSILKKRKSSHDSCTNVKGPNVLFGLKIVSCSQEKHLTT